MGVSVTDDDLGHTHKAIEALKASLFELGYRS